MQLLLVLTGFAVSTGMAAPARADFFYDPRPRYSHFYIGNQSLDNAWSLRDQAGRRYHADGVTLRTLGASLQRSEVAGWLQYGLEGALQTSYENNTKWFFRFDDQGATLAIAVDSDLWLTDVSMGAFAAVQPLPWLRAYASAGPAIYWGHLRHRDAAADPGSSGATIILGDLMVDTRTSNNRFDFALYGRAGVDLVFPRGVTLGLGLRQSNAQLDFGSRGRIRLSEPQLLINLGAVYN